MIARCPVRKRDTETYQRGKESLRLMDLVFDCWGRKREVDTAQSTQQALASLTPSAYETKKHPAAPTAQ
jgi:hypothetical protein